MSGVDTVRGINYQHGHAILIALEVMADQGLHALRVEGIEDVLDIEVYALDQTATPQLRLVRALQIKSRTSGRAWAPSELLVILTRWANVPTEGAVFEIVTDGRLGPAGMALSEALESAHQGNLTALADFLNVLETDELCVRLATTGFAAKPE